ncbi:hypothetical protein ACFS5L_17700 [Streptomyces phyllanthi]|uniref:Regulatory protein n=1 Tax=Streptomyces phyllanthi TaxID=1803180 RepID=A0A5N8VXQ6_9ACTN|nr:hypothetical protein [Streptomyces phyllanthi]MPY38715.1 hypothetical protein [Streptomyces phyllanthi]
MSESTTSPTELTSQYLAQVASDLERNIKEQERISAEIVALQEQLSALKNDHTVLVNMQQVLGVTSDDVRPAPVSDSASVPPPRKKATAKSATPKRTRAKKDTAAESRTPVRKPAAEKSQDKTVVKTAQPTLVELVRRHLAEQSEPRSAAEIATALGQDHPERGIKATVIRTTLEGLVAKNQAQRTKQGNSVFYTTPDTAEDAAQPQPQSEAQPDQGE